MIGVKMGLAQVATFPPDVKYVDRFLEVPSPGCWSRDVGESAYDTATTPKSSPAKAKPPANVSVYSGPYDPFRLDRDYGDFSTHAEVQAFYEAAGGPISDPHRLSRDRDRSACEDLP